MTILDEIYNTRLFRLKQRTLPWRFDIEHKPGKSNLVADATSRHTIAIEYSESASLSLSSDNDHEEISMIAAIQSDFENLTMVTWQRVKEKTQRDSTMQELMSILDNGFPQRKEQLPPSLAPFWEFRKSLYLTNGIILYNDRVVIPRFFNDPS